MVKKTGYILITVMYFTAEAVYFFMHGFEHFIYADVLLTGLFIASLYDIKDKMVPVLIPLITAVSLIAFNIIDYGFKAYITSMITAAAVMILFGLVSFLTKGKIGMADVMMVSVCALYYRFSEFLVAVTIAFLIASVAAAVMTRLKKEKQTEIAFIPFLLSAVLICSF